MESTIISDFIKNNAHLNTSELSLKLSKRSDLPKQFIINQIVGRQKAKQKFPFLLDFENFIFPIPKSVEQASSESTAKFKASLFEGNRMIDLSGGMGIDSLFFAKSFDRLDYVEPNSTLCENLQENTKILGINNISILNQTAEEALSQSTSAFDLIYVDPDRRKGHSRLFKIEDCEPKLGELMPMITEKSKALLVKLSPMLDIKQVLKELANCKSILVVAVKNEVKELLVHIEHNFSKECSIKCINLETDQHPFDFQYSQEQSTITNFSESKQFLYDPNTAILKAGAFKSIAEQYHLQKLAINTHLYTSEVCFNEFPGRIFEIIENSHPKHFKNKKANVITKNHSLKAEQIKAKYKIKDGGEDYLIGFKNLEKKDLFVMCRRVR